MKPMVPGNRWDLLNPPSVDDFTASMRVSVCVPVRDGGERFDRAMASLTALEHPPELTEIVVVDDGSRDAVSVPSGFDPAVDVVVRRRDEAEGFGASAARNAAAEAASGDVLVFLDGDVIASPLLVKSMARWFDVCDDVAVLAAMRFVDVDHISASTVSEMLRDGSFAAEAASARIPGQEWRATAAAQSRGLTVDDVDLYRVVTGAGLAVRRDRFREIGGFREIPMRGVGDTEFGYRLLSNGAVLVPEPEAMAWHQGPATLRGSRARAHEAVRRPTLSRLVPLEPHRRGVAAGPSSMPYVARARVHVVAPVDARDRAESSVQRIARLEGDEVEVVMTDSSVPSSSFSPVFAEIWTTVDVEWGAGTLARVLDLLTRADVGCVRVPGAEHDVVVACTTRAIRRALHGGPADSAVPRAGSSFGVHWSAAEALDLRRVGVAASTEPVRLRDVLRVRVERTLTRIRRVGRAERRRRAAATGRDG